MEERRSSSRQTQSALGVVRINAVRSFSITAGFSEVNLPPISWTPS
jgi:hypothetical protein